MSSSPDTHSDTPPDRRPAAPAPASAPRPGSLSVTRLLSSPFQALNRRIDWHRLPLPLGVLNLVTLRDDLRRLNLYDARPGAVPAGEGHASDGRSPDGGFTDRTDPTMGRAWTSFGRNAPLPQTFGEREPGLLDPNPRLVSRKLLARTEFQPAPHLNVLVPAWLQFMVHDWFAHEAGVRPNDESQPEHLRRPYDLPLEDDDDWPDRPMQIRRTPPDPAGEPGRPASYRNTETHWWDASQIYGSSAARLEILRTDPATGTRVPDGKLHLVEGHLPIEKVGTEIGRPAEVELAGVNGNWWLGLSLMHTLFVREHNHVCDRLKAEYPTEGRDPEWLFQKARLIVSAVLAKIHTVEWTPAVLNTPTMRYAMRANWWGLLGEEFERGFGRMIPSEILGGIPTSDPDHHAAPYAMTEEFAAVYRMHSLLPDDFSFRRAGDGTPIMDRTLLQIAGAGAHALYRDASFEDALYSFGTANPGLLRLHNFPRSLMRLEKQPPSGRTIDVAATDVLRDRERGVPRYCAFREMLRMRVPRTFLELTGGDADAAAELEEVYGEVEKVDLLVGCAAEKWPEGFGFSDTAFRVFILMASRRLKSDRFFTTDFTDAVYTPFGMDWIRRASMTGVLLRHAPALAPHLAGKRNAFFDWRKEV